MTDIKKKTEKDITSDFTKNRKSLREFRFGIAGSNIKNVKEAKFLKKEIARGLTELNTRKENE